MLNATVLTVLTVGEHVLLSDGAGAPPCMREDTHRRAGRSQVLQHVGDGDLQQGLSEELLAHRAAVVVVFLRRKDKKALDNDTDQ